MAYNLGKMKRIHDLRSVWPHEANDFTKWLAQEANLAELGNNIGIDIDLEERESSVGSFNVDIYAVESGTGRKIIIENQLEDTNHDHLGKLITYASGKGAEVIVWIVKRARDEHRQAIEWLNRHTDSNIGFFLVEIELWQIDDSLLAPKFNVVEKPNDWAKTMKVVEGLNSTEMLKLNFWQFFNDTMSQNAEFCKYFNLRKPQPHHWYDLSIGTSSCFISLNINTQKKKVDAGIYIPNDKELFHKFKACKIDFEKSFGCDVEFRDTGKASRILIAKSINVKDSSKWLEISNWLFDRAKIFKTIASNIDK
jgi:hypothetical protein